MAYQSPPGYPPSQPGGYAPPPSGYGYGPPSGYGQTPYGQYGQPVGPATHPFATTALVLGLVACFSTVLTGAPAILFGYKAIKAIEAEPHRFDGKGMATTGVVFGWIGCGLFSVLLGRVLGYTSVAGGVGAVVLGLTAGGMVIVLARKRSWAALRASAFASSPALLLVGGTWGMLGAHADAAWKDAVCQQHRDDAKSQIAAQNFAAARAAVASARAACPESEDAKLADLDLTVGQAEQASQKAAADRAASEMAAAAAAKEKEAVETFPQKRLDIVAISKRASDETNVGEWFAAQADLSKAEAELSGFGGTSVATTKEWADLSAKLDALDKRLQSHRGRVADQEGPTAGSEPSGNQGLLSAAFAKYECSDGAAFADILKLGNQPAPCGAPSTLVACDAAEGKDTAVSDMRAAGCTRAGGSTRQSFYCCPRAP